MTLSETTAQELAEKWSCSPRTIRRWHTKINVHQPIAVISHILGTRSSTTKQLLAAKREIGAISGIDPNTHPFRAGFFAALKSP